MSKLHSREEDMSTKDALLSLSNIEKESTQPIEKRGGETLLDRWNAFLQEIEHEFGKETIDRWLRSLVCTYYDERSLEFEALDSFQVLWFEEHIRPKISIPTLSCKNKKKAAISVYVKSVQKDKKKIKNKLYHTAYSHNEKNIIKNEANDLHFTLDFPELDPTATFDSFITAEANDVIIKLLDETCSYLTVKKIASLHVANSIATWEASKVVAPNPIYLWGPSGCGKSHILQAITYKLRRSGIQVRQASLDLFTDHVIKSIRAGEMSTFRSLWRNVDVLIVDDIHLLARKSATQEEFFHTFNSLHTAGKQIIVSSLYPPPQLQFIEQRLVSRFEWGIVLHIEPLSKKKIPTVLEKKSQMLHFPIMKKYIMAIADLFSTNVKSSVRALEAVILRTTLTKKDINTFSLLQIKQMLSDLIEEEQENALTHEKIIAVVAQHYGVIFEDIMGKSQSRECAMPRQLAMYLIRKHLKMPYMKIGDIFVRDHSTVMSSIRHIEQQIQNTELGVGSAIANIEISLSNISR